LHGIIVALRKEEEEEEEEEERVLQAARCVRSVYTAESRHAKVTTQQGGASVT
jgi:hypothetical protein